MRKLLQASAFMLASLSANATTFGPVENFDVVNDTNTTAHGFQIRLHGITSNDITSIFGDANRWPNMERYGAPTVTDGQDGNGAYVDVVYQAVYNGTWSAGTPSGTLPVSPSDSCWPLGAATYGPLYPCDHFGVSTSTPATSVDYNWLLETATPGVLTGAVSNVPAPVWTVTPAVVAQPAIPAAPGQPAVAAVIAQPAVVAVAVKAPPKPAPYEFGEPKWVKVTATGYGYDVAVEDLVAENAAIKQAKTNTQIEWQLLQVDSGSPGSGQVDLSGVAPDPGYKSVIYRFEFYAYTGAFDPATHEALPINGDTATPAASDLGIFLVAQNAAVNLDGQVPPAVAPVAPAISASLPDGVAGVDYGVQTISVTPGNANDTVNVTVTGLPNGLIFDGVSTISGTPAQLGAFTVSITATDATNNTSVSAAVPINVTDPAIAFNVVPTTGVTGSAYSIPLAATGGDAPFTYTVTGALPVGLSVMGSAISGTPSQSGSFPIKITATDSVGASQATNATISIVSPVVNCSGVNASVASVSNSGWVAADGTKVAYAPNAGTTFAPGLTFGAYAVGQTITYSGAMDPTNAFCVAATSSVSLPLTVPTPVFTSGTVGVAYTPVTITPAGGWSPYAIAVSGLPSGLTFNGTTISGTPTVSGTFPLAISVIDAKSNKYNITTSSIVVASAPAPASCSLPAGAKASADINAKITAVSGSNITIGAKPVTVLPCAAITWSGNWSGLTKTYKVGYSADMTKGYVLNGVTYATAINVDNGL